MKLDLPFTALRPAVVMKRLERKVMANGWNSQHLLTVVPEGK